MDKNWYQTEADTQRGGWYAPAEEPPLLEEPAPRKKKRRTVALVTALAVLFLIPGSSLLFRSRGGSEPEPEPDSGSSGSGFTFHWDKDGSFGFSGDGEEEGDGFSDNFQDFFENYYTSYEEAEECTIPTVTAPEGLSIRLCESGTEELSLQEIYRRCAPFIVAISAYADPESDSHYSWGTGIIMDPSGYVVTNSHIIEGTCRAKVTLQDDREFEAKLVGYDSRSDIAVLKVEASGLPTAEFSVSSGLQVGDEVIAIGNPLGDSFRSTMTNGIITGIDRDISYNGTTLTLIQTNAALNEGNSGGALINRSGQVIGITNMKMSNTYAGSVTIEGVGFAIPSVTVKEMADGLLTAGKVLGRPALGLTVGAIPVEAAEHYKLPEGLYVSRVSHGSDCETKGLQVGDVLTHVDGEEVRVTSDVVDRIADMQVGDTLTLTVFREGKTFDVIVALVDVTDVY